MQQEYLIDEERLVVSPSGGVDLSYFSPCDPRELLKHNAHYGYVGRLDKGKGLDTLIEAFKEFTKNSNGVRLSIVGTGQFSKEYKKLAGSLLGHSINFLGPMKHNELVSFYQSLDYLVFPSELNESLGLVGIEAMACRVPVIGTNLGGMSDYLIPSINGFQFEAGSVKSLCETLELSLNLTEEEWARMADQALETSKLYDSRRVQIELSELFINLNIAN
ncbi:hypothetical protein GCM10027098_39920 [Bowmanella dokdonensis]|nr:glycosyltransferase [Bowmanella dokdonensis]